MENWIKLIIAIVLYMYGVFGSIAFMRNIWKNGIDKRANLHLFICFIPIINTIIAFTNYYIDYITRKTKRRL